MSNRWIPVSNRFPDERELVELKRDLSVGIGGYTGREKLEWVSKGRYRKYNDTVQWSVNKVEGLTLNNSRPTHWRVLTKSRKEL